MRYPPLGPELRELLASGEEGHGKLREVLENQHPKEAAEMLTCLSPDEITATMGLLPMEIEQDMFRYFEPDLQEQIVLGSSRSQVQDLLSGLPSDERAEFLDELDDGVRQQLLPLLAREDRLDVLRRERFEDDQVGAIMSTEFCILGEELTMPRALDELRRQAPSKETIYYSYTVDRGGKLKGFVSLRRLIIANPRSTVGDVMKSEVVSIPVDADQEEAAQMIREYDLLALPVVDSGHHMVGLVTHEDAIDIIEEENTEDIKRIAGITATDDESEDYLGTSAFNHFRGRVAWLTFLAISFLGIAVILDRYDFGSREGGTMLVAFLPLLLATGANVGGQASALILRALAVHSLDHTAMAKVLWKEFRIGLSLCATLGCAVFCLTWLYTLLAPGESFDLRTCLGISIAVGTHVISTALVGALIPLVFSRIGMRPEVFSHPALNCVADTTGTIIYLIVIYQFVLPPV